MEISTLPASVTCCYANLGGTKEKAFISHSRFMGHQGRWAGVVIVIHLGYYNEIP